MKKYRSQATPNRHRTSKPSLEFFCSLWLSLACIWLMFLVWQVAATSVSALLVGVVAFCIGVSTRTFDMQQTDRARFARVAVLTMLTVCGVLLLVVLRMYMTPELADNFVPALAIVVLPGFLAWSTRWI